MFRQAITLSQFGNPSLVSHSLAAGVSAAYRQNRWALRFEKSKARNNLPLFNTQQNNSLLRPPEAVKAPIFLSSSQSQANLWDGNENPLEHRAGQDNA